MSTRTLILTCAFLFAGACDDGSAPAPSDSEFRDGYICLTKDTPPPTLVAKTGRPQPDDYRELLIALAGEQVDEMLVATAAWDPNNAETCSKICDARDLGWDGENCIAERDYTYGEVELYETEKGEARYRVPVDTGNSVMGCACAE